MVVQQTAGYPPAGMPQLFGLKVARGETESAALSHRARGVPTTKSWTLGVRCGSVPCAPKVLFGGTCKSSMRPGPQVCKSWTIVSGIV